MGFSVGIVQHIRLHLTHMIWFHDAVTAFQVYDCASTSNRDVWLGLIGSEPLYVKPSSVVRELSG